MAVTAASEPNSEQTPSAFSLEVAEQRLIRRLDSQPNREAAHSRRPSWPVIAGSLAACLTLTFWLVEMRLHHPTPQLSAQSAPVARTEGRAKADSTAQTAVDLRPQLERANQKIADLEQQLKEGDGRYRQLNTTVTNIQQQLAADADERKKLSDERDTVNQQLVAAQTEAQSLRDRTTASNTVATQQVAQIASLEAKIRDANAALDEKEKMLALDKEFLAHDRDIRDLIGARDLYIADIFDVAKDGTTNKPFGRIFYTKDKSLVFYGYDLDKQPGLKQSVAFQAWGSGDDKQDISLGLFYQDDSQKRWVLRFNDTKTLARLNMVFVTAEPKGGSAKPTSKPLLLAYLQMQPNHP